MKPCKFCGNQPWHESDPQYEGDTVSDIYTFLECSSCRAQTKSFPKSGEAVEAWQNGEYIPNNGKNIMANTNYATMQAENTPVSFQDHNGKLEVIPSKDDYLILTPKQAAELIRICSAWLAEDGDKDEENL